MTTLLPQLSYEVNESDLLDSLQDFQSQENQDIRYFQEFDDHNEQLILEAPYLGAYRIA